MKHLTDRLPEPDITNTAAVIVSYYPDDRFAERLARLSKQFAAVYWVENTPGAAIETKQRRDDKVSYLSRA